MTYQKAHLEDVDYLVQKREKAGMAGILDRLKSVSVDCGLPLSRELRRTSVHFEGLQKWFDMPSLSRPIQNGENNAFVAPLEVIPESLAKKLGDFMAVVTECSTTPCPKDNGIVDMFHPHGQYFENPLPHSRAYLTSPLGGQFGGIYRWARDDSNCVRFIEKAPVI